MRLHLRRTDQSPNTTVGVLTLTRNGREIFKCYTLEDTLRHQKIATATAIPTGTYEIILRTVGRIHTNYLRRFGSAFHKGTLWLQSVPNFQWILIHIGNTQADTDGCILVGSSISPNRTTGEYILVQSTVAYQKMYEIVRDELLERKKVYITIENDNHLKIK